MNLLDDIWDEPVEASATPNPPKEALFLAGSDDEDDIDGPNSQRHAQKAPADIDMETVEAIFAGVNDENEDAFTFKPLAPSLDTEALRREAESRHKNRLPSFTPHAILPSSSPPRDTGDGRDGLMKDRGGEKQKDAKKDRRKPARLDERRLLGPTGFPQLIKDTKDFRTKGKGHEATDLNRLLQVYQFWTHGMYPKTQFRDTVERVEKLCHSKRMNVSLSVWRDEVRGRVNGKQDLEDDGVIDLTEDEGSFDGKRETNSNNHSYLTSDSEGAEYASSSSRPPSRPPSSGLEPDDDDDFDLDAIFRVDGKRREEKVLAPSGGRNSDAGNNQGGRTTGKGSVAASLADDDAMWDELEAIQSAPIPAQTISANTGADDDQAMWDALDEVQEATENVIELNPATSNAPPVAQNMDDEDMWDIVNELEKVTPMTTTTVSEAPVPMQDDYDIEDLYI